MANETAPSDWRERLTTGDVVNFRFPVDDPDNPDAVAKRRPCLVYDIRWFSSQKFAELAYGTGARTRANHGFEVRVNHPAARKRAGLDRSTRFIGACTIMVSLDHPGFEPGDLTRSPIIGTLEPPLQKRLLQVRAKRAALGNSAVPHAGPMP